MTEHSDIPHRLKALRELSGLSVRELARRVGMSSSGYSHYETPGRFKELALPMAQAKSLAAAMMGTAVSHEDVMALAGIPVGYAVEVTPVSGLAEPARAFRIKQREVADDANEPALRAIFGSAAATPATYEICVDLPAFALQAGDIAVIDLSRLPEPGELAIVSVFDEITAASTTAIYRYLPPYLQNGDINQLKRPFRVDQMGVTVRHPVVASLRGIPRD